MISALQQLDLVSRGMASLSLGWHGDDGGESSVRTLGTWTPKTFVDALNDTLTRSFVLFDQYRKGISFPAPYTFDDFIEILRSSTSVAEGFIGLVPPADPICTNEIGELRKNVIRAREILAEDDAELNRELEAWDKASEQDFESFDKTLE